MVGKPSEDCEEFVVMNVVIPLCFIERLRMEAHSEVFSSVVLLSEDGARREGGGVNLEKEGSSEIGLFEGGVCDDNVNESVKGGGALQGPCEGVVFLCQGHQWAGDISIVRDERPLITQYTEYTSDFFHGSECPWPV